MRNNIRKCKLIQEVLGKPGHLTVFDALFSLKTIIPITKSIKQVCVQLPTCADNVALPAFAAERRAAAPCCCGAGRAAIDRYLLPAGPTAANLPHAAAAGEWDRQTDGRTPYRFIDPVPHTVRAAPITAKLQQIYVFVHVIPRYL